MAKQTSEFGKNWYAVHTYSGYEDAVARNLRQRIESLGMEDQIFQVIVPKEKKIKIKGGKRRVVEEEIYPGYVLVEMVVTDASWYVVRNTPRVTGFVGDPVRIIDGPFKDFEGKVHEIDEARGKAKVFVLMFGRETPVELDFLQVKKL